MLTKEQVLEAIRNGRESRAIDGRDFARLADFFEVEHWDMLGLKLKEGAEPPTPKAWIRTAIVDQLREDVGFGFENALNKRGISASCMHGVVCMWLWILEEDLPETGPQYYAQYGLPLLKATARRFGFTDETVSDAGTEYKYSSEAEYEPA